MQAQQETKSPSSAFSSARVQANEHAAAFAESCGGIIPTSESCRQPNALLWSLPRRSSATACSRIQAMKRSNGMGAPWSPLTGKLLPQRGSFPDLKLADIRIDQQGD